MARAVGILLAVLLAAAPAWAAEVVLDLPVRGSVMRVLLVEPDAPPTAAVVLIAGGAGRLDIESSGRIGKLAGNHLVRTRGEFARAGFLAAVPDLAADLKQGGTGVRDSYRWSAEHAADIGLLVEHLRRQAGRVYVIGTSRGAISTANAAVRLQGGQKPDAIVISSGMIMQQPSNQPSVQRNVAPLSAITMPVLLAAHEKDACVVTPPAGVPAFRALLTAAPRVDIRLFTGGQPDRAGEECEAGGPHGFAGIDRVVVTAIADWLRSLDQAAR